MKKLFFLLIAAGGAASAIAQGPSSYAHSHGDSLLGRWVIDINAMGGLATQTFTTANSVNNYTNSVNTNTGDLTYKNGYSVGAEAEVGFFFGKKRHWGIGTGFMYMQQFGDARLDNFHTEYQATDANGNIFRQVVSGNDVRENVTSYNMNIPVVLKYKNRFSKHWGFAADAGALINVQMKNSYSTNASFNYEAIYKLQTNEAGQTVSVYDNAPTASPNDWFITNAEFYKNNPNGNIQDYYAAKRALGFNVGQGVRPNTETGNVSYKTASVGFIIQPSFQYFLSDNAALNLGVYYMFQPFTNNAQNNYRITDGLGNYSSTLNNVSSSVNQAYGINLGARFFLGRKDRDHDGVPDRKDKCPDVWGLAKFDGCPDTDGDGVPDKEDSCVYVPGLVQFHGCPDTDGDGIIDKEDSCPYNAGPVALHGCPDRDGDGIADKDDLCPDVFGLAQFQGCPDRDGDGIPDKDDKCPDVAGPASNQGCPIVDTVKETIVPQPEGVDISTPILFDLNKATIHENSIPVLKEAAHEMKEDKSKTLVVDGYTDSTGPLYFNNALSVKRANAVKNNLAKMGVNPRRVKTVGHGPKNPASDNSTPEGRQQNRRAVMKMKP